MLVLLIVIPALIIAVSVVVVLDRVGVLAPFDGGRSDRQGGLLENIPKGALLGAGALMALWILAWLIFLVIGLSILAS